MSVKKVPGGFKYGNSGKVFKSQGGAMKHAVASRASGHQEKPKGKEK